MKMSLMDPASRSLFDQVVEGQRKIGPSPSTALWCSTAPGKSTEGEMARKLSEEAREDLLERGYSRRQLAGIAAVFGLGAVAATAGRPAWAAPGGPGAIDYP